MYCFHPSPTDRRIHDAIVHRRHTGKVPQTLLQSIQQSPHVEFVARPAVLRGLYSFGFDLGLSIMHCKSALWNDEVAAAEKGTNLWDFSSGNSYSQPARISLDTISTTSRPPTSSRKQKLLSFAIPTTLAQIPKCRACFAFWINTKFSLFRNTVRSEGLATAVKISTQFQRSDDKLAALRESYDRPKSTPSTRSRPAEHAKTARRTPGSNCIPPETYAT
ncbi:hypothetical protein PHMEG_00036068 [Phytophthora megakarya]|uniref:Uncharacterized protein n=1 Tax=Phytophthora megakarya TaxID=4795 RepID=A0A225UMP3_9STRA|nr:hypothetical protein PHMEG_00036068 [Phytophthora megakarya]